MKTYLVETTFKNDKKASTFKRISAKNLDNLRARLASELKKDKSISYIFVWTDKTTPEYLELWREHSAKTPAPKLWGALTVFQKDDLEWATSNRDWYAVNSDGTLGRRL